MAANAEAAADLVAPPLFDRVPADTPYVLGNFKPIPRAMMEKLFSKFAPLMEQAGAQIGALLTGLEDSALPSRIAAAVWAELTADMSLAGVEKLGFSAESRTAIYGLGVFPVLRMELRDGAALRATVERVEEKVGVKAATATYGEGSGAVTYWTQTLGDAGELRFGAAIIGDILVAFVMPEASVSAALPMILGDAKPKQSIADTHLLQKVAARHGLHGFSVGVVDHKRLAKIMLGASTGLAAETWKAAGFGDGDLSATCHAEINGLLDQLPRSVYGYIALDDTRMATRFVLETAPAIARALSDITTQVPGVGAHEGLFNLGVAVDLAKAVGVVKSAGAAIADTPFRCEDLSFFNELADDAAGISPTFGSLTQGLRGVNVVLHSLELSGGMPQNVKGTAILMLPEAATKLKPFAATMLGGVDLKADAAPIALPTVLLPPSLGIKEAFVALNDDAVAVSVGAQMASKLAPLLKTDAPKGPAFALGYSGQLLKTALSQAPSDPSTTMAVEMFTLIDWLGYSGGFSDAGVYFDTVLVFK